MRRYEDVRRYFVRYLDASPSNTMDLPTLAREIKKYHKRMLHDGPADELLVVLAEVLEEEHKRGAAIDNLK